MGSIRRQRASGPAGVLRKNIYVILVVLAVSGAAGFLVPLYVSSAVYGVPWRNADDTLVNISERGTPLMTPTWAKPGMPQVRVNFWVTSTARAETAAVDAASATALRAPATATPTSTLATPTPTRRLKSQPTATSTRRPKEPTSTPKPPKPTATKAPPRKPTNTPPPPPTAAPTQGVPPTASTSGAPIYGAPTPMPGGAGMDIPGSAYASAQGPAAGAPEADFLWQAAAHLWSLLRGWWR